jgi:cysteine desulfurase
MDAEGVAISTRSACSAGNDEPSHVIKALGTPPELAGTALRITLLPTASYRDARRIAKTLQDVTKRYRIV